MWTSERGRLLPVQEPAAELGLVTLGGDPAGVNVGGERRWLPVYSPGGYSWRPAAGDKVLVLKAGAERESPCVLGTPQQETDLKPGEVRLSGGGSGALWVSGSNLELRGQILINGTSLDAYIQSIVASMLG